MPEDIPAGKISEKSLDAFLEGLLQELKNPSDLKLLEEVRSAFRKRVPFHLRSYAAALMILRAAGVSRGRTAHQAKTLPAAATGRGAAAVQLRTQKKPENSSAGTTEKAGSKTDAAKTESSRVSLFISMGKRQRLRPSELKSLMVERSGLPPESFGRVNVRENYAFIEVPVAQAAQILAAMEGAELNGRPLEIKPARKRSEQEQEGI